MNPNQSAMQCDEEKLAEIVQAMHSSDEDALQLLAQNIAIWPFDYRLCFLRASICAAQGRYAEAHDDLVRTIELAPEFSIAHFMLGFLALMNNRVADAHTAWSALDSLPVNDPLYIFKSGLLHLANDEFETALAELQRGLAVNQQYPAVNSYVQAVIHQLQEKQRSNEGNDDAGIDNSSIALSAYLSNSTRH